MILAECTATRLEDWERFVSFEDPVMEKETPSAQAPNAGAGPNQGARRVLRGLGLCLLALGVLVAGYFMIRGTAQNGHAQGLEEPSDKPPSPLFLGWKKPDLALVVSGQMHGYLQPCGCSSPQYGGLARRYNFLQSLRAKGWQVMAVDLGDIAQTTGPQRILKYEFSMKALKLMGYQSVGIGKNELLTPLTEALAHYSIQDPRPRPVAANLLETEPGQLFEQLNVRKFEAYEATSFKVGVTGAIGAHIAKQVERDLPKTENVAFVNNWQALPQVLADMGKAKVDLGVLLYQGLEKEARTCAEFLHDQHKKNAAVVPVHIMMCLTEEEEPPGVAIKDAPFPNTSIFTLGHKGRYVGVIGIWKTPHGVDMKYQLVSIGPEFDQKEVADKANPVADLMEKYALEVRDKNFLVRYPRGNHPVQATHKTAKFIGSERCGDCHQEAYDIWKNKTGHAHAFDTLVKAENPRHRQFDGECVSCHTVGFQYHTGYFDPPKGSTPKQIEKHNLKLLHVGCESCHGPGSEHANNPNNEALYPLINPYRPSAKERDPKTSEKDKKNLFDKRMMNLDYNLCQKCHDIENDVHWGKVSFQEKWNAVAHPTPRPAAKAAQARKDDQSQP